MSPVLYGYTHPEKGLLYDKPNMPVVFTSRFAAMEWRDEMRQYGFPYDGYELTHIAGVDSTIRPFHVTLRCAMRADDCNHYQLATATGVHLATVYSWLRPPSATKSSSSPKPDTVRRIALHLGLDKTTLLHAAGVRQDQIRRIRKKARQ